MSPAAIADPLYAATEEIRAALILLRESVDVLTTRSLKDNLASSAARHLMSAENYIAAARHRPQERAPTL